MAVVHLDYSWEPWQIETQLNLINSDLQVFTAHRERLLALLEQKLEEQRNRERAARLGI